MKHFFVYDESGTIFRNGHCHERDFALQAANPGETVGEGIVNRETQRVVDGQVVDIAADVLAARATEVARLAARAAVMNQISRLESRQHRAMREFVLTGDTTRLAEIETQIQLLRAQLT